MPWHYSASCGCYVALVACPVLALCASLYTPLYAVFMLFDYTKRYKNNEMFSKFDYASFMRFLPMRRMFQVLLYACFMQYFFDTCFLQFNIVFMDISL